MIVLCAVGLIIVCHNWEQHYASAARGIAFAPALIPMVIYSVYQQVPPRRRIAPKRYAIFHYLQLFIGTPLVSYDDIFGKSPHKLAHIRFAGMKAITVAIVAAICAWAIDQILIATPMTQLRGGRLLFFSYLYYVRVYCAFVITVNTVIGALRLFGVPVRDNFNYWLLARTPNEHWRRWNILYREWVITFIFFPIMRSKRWLFAAVMVSLLTTGILHGLYRIFAEEFDWYYFGYIMFYWSINGLAIYMVIKIPILFPQIIKRLKVQTSYIWSGIGIILTSIFYAILIGLRPYKSLPEALDYMERLVSL